MMVNSPMNKFSSENLTVQAMYHAADRSRLPGPPESVSTTLVEGISPPEIKTYVESVLTYVDG